MNETKTHYDLEIIPGYYVGYKMKTKPSVRCCIIHNDKRPTNDFVLEHRYTNHTSTNVAILDGLELAFKSLVQSTQQSSLTSTDLSEKDMHLGIVHGYKYTNDVSKRIIAMYEFIQHIPEDDVATMEMICDNYFNSLRSPLKHQEKLISIAILARQLAASYKTFEIGIDYNKKHPVVQKAQKRAKQIAITRVNSSTVVKGVFGEQTK